MFFTWINKNKNFQRKSGLSGQITPFLLVVLVILLVAAIATINIGRVSLDKTCSANAADAGSLAAASAWASALNTLAEINRDQLQTWFDLNYYTYGQIYFEAASYIDEAIMDAAAASAAAGAAAVASYYPPICIIPWFWGLAAVVLDVTASYLALEASMAVSAFSISVQFMKSITDSFHEQQWNNYCAAREFMDASYLNARKTGLSYAFSNSCIPAKLSDAQNNAFSSWMGAEGPYNDGSYNWTDKLSQTHTVTATLDLPNITSYELQHTEGAYSRISDLLDGAISRSQLISGLLNSTAVILGTAGAIALAVFVYSIVVAAACSTPYGWASGACESGCGSLWGFWKGLGGLQAYIVIALAAVVAAAGGFSVYLLKSDNDEAFDNWAPDGIQSSTSCADVGDLMIVKIARVILPSWITTCVTTQTHPGTSSGIVPTNYPTITSSSISRFDGGDVGTFLDAYYPRIVGTR